jgi:peptidoglycan/LPS O-acetylase OafA/YrhL
MSSTSLLTRNPNERFHHPELDVLRFFAFVFIFLHHSFPHETAFYGNLHIAPVLASALATLAISGAFAVDLFLLISAYLVTELFIRERALRGHIDLRAFYSRRFLRIWPLYYSFLALAWAMQWFVPGQHIGWRAGLAFSLFAGNWWVVFVGFPSSVIFPLWFISAQEQFYFFWPAIMRRLSARGLLLAAAAMLVTANLTRWYLAVRHTWESRIWCNTFVQLDALALGILLAVLLAGRVPRLTALHRAALVLGGIACFFLAASYFRIKSDPLTTARVLLGYPVVALGAVALFLATLRPAPAATGGPHPPVVGECGAGGRWPLVARGWQMLGRAFIYLGRISFGLYVFHIIGLMITDFTIHHQDSSFGRYLFREAAAFATTIVLASLSYRFLETPFLGLKQRFRRVPSGTGS